jgi:hypothetical protein
MVGRYKTGVKIPVLGDTPIQLSKIDERSLLMKHLDKPADAQITPEDYIAELKARQLVIPSGEDHGLIVNPVIRSHEEPIKREPYPRERKRKNRYISP